MSSPECVWRVSNESAERLEEIIMSLIRQLWIAIAVVTLLAFSGSLVLSTLSARQYLEEQLRLKNVDNATSLALSMSQLPKTRSPSTCCWRRSSMPDTTSTSA